MKKNRLLLLIGVVLIVLSLIQYMKTSGTNFANIFKEQPIAMDKTANVLEEIHRLAELTTATYSKEYVVSKQKASEIALPGIKLPIIGHALGLKDELVLIVKGKVRAGFDLSKLQEQDITIDDAGLITLNLPQAQILEVITNPSDFETFVESGIWSHEEVTRYKNEARAAIERDALNNGILELAEQAGKEKLSVFLHAINAKMFTFSQRRTSHHFRCKPTN